MHLFSMFLAQMEPHNFQCIFCNSFNVFYLNTYVCYQNPSNKNKDNVELRFYSVVTCLTLPNLHNVFQSSMHALTILIQGCSFIIALILCFYVLSRMNKKQTA